MADIKIKCLIYMVHITHINMENLKRHKKITNKTECSKTTYAKKIVDISII